VHLLALSEDNLNEEVFLKSAKKIMRQAIDHLLGGREIKARTLYVGGGKAQ
jgi:DNA repair protein RecO (recombination protein O)